MGDEPGAQAPAQRSGHRFESVVAGAVVEHFRRNFRDGQTHHATAMPPRMHGMAAPQQQPQQRNSETGERMEPAIKHTYLCQTDDWYTERTEVGDRARTPSAQGGMRKCHKCFERSDGYSVESVAKFSMIHRDERSAKAAAFADAKMQMVAGDFGASSST